MFDNETILKAAKEFALEKYTYYESDYDDMDDEGQKRIKYQEYNGFIEGVKWIINNYINI